MKKLMDILSNPTKRIPMETVLKCEAVLERMNLDASDTQVLIFKIAHTLGSRYRAETAFSYVVSFFT